MYLVLHDPADAVDEQTRRRVLHHDAACTQLDRPEHIHRIDCGRQQNHTCRIVSDQGERIDPAHARHGDIEQHDVRGDLTRDPRRVEPVDALGDHCESGFTLEKPSQTVSEDLVIVGNRDPNVLAFRHAWDSR